MSQALERLYTNNGQMSMEVKADADCDWCRTYPVIFEFLTCTMHGGRPRQPGTLLLVCEGGKVKAWVNDKQANRAAFVSAASFSELFASVDRGMAENSLEWRIRDSGGFGTGRKFRG